MAGHLLLKVKNSSDAFLKQLFSILDRHVQPALLSYGKQHYEDFKELTDFKC